MIAMKRIRWNLVGLAAFVVAAAPFSAQAQPRDSYPSRPIRVITGSPGSTSDLSARFVAQKLTERWGQQAVVDNRPGAGGIIGVEIGARAAPDGYTLIVGHVGTHASAQMLHKNLGYDPIKDFEPISNLVNVAVVFVVHPSVAANTLKDFVAFSQGSGGRVNYGSPGAGTSGHLTGELFNLVTKARMTHIPYKGAGFAVTANIANEVQTSFLSTATAQPHVKAGRLKPLVVVRKTRFAGMPDVPSSVEAGYPDLDSNAWFGLFAPAKTPKHLIMRVNKEVADALNTPHVRETLLGQGAEVAPTSPEAFGEYVKAEVVKWTRVVKESGYKQ
jgi:tripartite-type tricarboxylate transporter receptor subunit TctC